MKREGDGGTIHPPEAYKNIRVRTPKGVSRTTQILGGNKRFTGPKEGGMEWGKKTTSTMSMYWGDIHEKRKEKGSVERKTGRGVGYGQGYIAHKTTYGLWGGGRKGMWILLGHVVFVKAFGPDWKRLSSLGRVVSNSRTMGPSRVDGRGEGDGFVRICCAR